MRVLTIILILLLTGCSSSGIFLVPKQEYKQQLQTLGVLPLLVDSRSVINHPAAEQIVDLMRRATSGLSADVVTELRRKKGYFDVRILAEPARLVADKLLVAPNVDGFGQPAGYQLNQSYLSELCKDSVVDGVLILILQGVEHNAKRWSRNTFETLVTDYNDIVATASVVAADGRVLWELNGSEASVILPLQYADFDEAYFNKSDVVNLKTISFTGLEKTLLTMPGKESDSLKSAQVSDWLKKVTSALSPALFR